ncbi:hypothetical protein D9M72_253580 [compost metagenome]
MDAVGLEHGCGDWRLTRSQGRIVACPYHAAACALVIGRFRVLRSLATQRALAVRVGVQRCRNGSIAPRDQRGIAASIDGRAGQGRVAPGHGDDIAASLHAAARTDGGLVVVIALPTARAGVLAGANGHRVQLQVSGCPEQRVLPSIDGAAGHAEVAPGQHRDVARAGDRCHGTDPRGAGAVATQRGPIGDRLRLVDHVAPGGYQRVGAADAAPEVAHILRCLDYRGAGRADLAPVDDVVADHLGCQVAHNPAAVSNVARCVQAHHVAGHHRTGAGQVHCAALCQIKLGQKYRLSRAIGQGHILAYQPHHVGGELRHLILGQADARRQVERLGVGRAVGHQCLVLLYLVAVARQVGAPGQLRHLVADQLLLVESVAQALLCHGRIKPELAQHVVAGDELAVLGEARVGRNQVGCAGRALVPVQAISGQGQVRQAAAGRADGLRPGNLAAGAAHLAAGRVAARDAAAGHGLAASVDGGDGNVLRGRLHRLVGRRDGRQRHHGGRRLWRGRIRHYLGVIAAARLLMPVEGRDFCRADGLLQGSAHVLHRATRGQAHQIAASGHDGRLVQDAAAVAVDADGTSRLQLGRVAGADQPIRGRGRGDRSRRFAVVVAVHAKVEAYAHLIRADLRRRIPIRPERDGIGAAVVGDGLVILRRILRQVARQRL